jgi:Arc/MetJ family transcription regulator
MAMPRTNIVIDEKLVRQAVQMTGSRSKREAVDIALRRLVEKGTLYRRLRDLKGKLHWEGNLDEMRKNRL